MMREQKSPDDCGTDVFVEAGYGHHGALAMKRNDGLYDCFASSGTTSCNDSESCLVGIENSTEYCFFRGT